MAFLTNKEHGCVRTKWPTSWKQEICADQVGGADASEDARHIKVKEQQDPN